MKEDGKGRKKDRRQGREFPNTYPNYITFPQLQPLLAAKPVSPNTLSSPISPLIAWLLPTPYSSSKMLYVFAKMVSTTLICHPASSMPIPGSPVPISVGPKMTARLCEFILLTWELSMTRCRCSVRARSVA